MRAISISALTVAVVLVATPTLYLSSVVFPSAFTTKLHQLTTNTLINTVYAGILSGCNKSIGQKHCDNLLLSIPEFESVVINLPDSARRAVLRGETSVTDLPRLHIYLTDGAINKLLKKRERMLVEKHPLRLSESGDWVNGKIISDDGTGQKLNKIKLRLRGRHSDHWQNPNKMSYRIQVRNNGFIFGMGKFLVHRPQTRADHFGPLLMDVLRHFGILAPRNFFVDVWLNEKRVGIMAVQEALGKEMLERQKRREGAIVALDDDWSDRQIFLTSNRSDSEVHSALEKITWHAEKKEVDAHVPLALRDFPVKAYSRDWLPGTVTGHNIGRATSMLRGMIEGRLPGSLVFDYELMSRWWTIVNMFHGNNGLVFLANRRHYFNPVSARLEPVSNDNNAAPLRDCANPDEPNDSDSLPSCVVTDISVTSIWKDAEFRAIAREEIIKISDTLGDKTFRDWFASAQNKYLRLLDLDGLEIDGVEYPVSRRAYGGAISIGVLERNLSEFATEVDHLFSRLSTNNYTAQERLSNIEREDGITRDDREVLKVLDHIYTHVRPFWFWSKQGSHIEIKNMTLDPVIIHSVFLGGNRDETLVPPDITIPVYSSGRSEHVFTSPIDISQLSHSDQMWIRYSYRGEEFKRPVILQFRDYDRDYESPASTKDWLDNNNVIVNQGTKTITFESGTYLFETSLEIAKGWQITILPGARLEFKNGARLKANGPVQALGEKDFPVQIVITSNPERGPMGSWGGLLVVEANRESILRYTDVTGVATDGFSERQDSHGLTGCVTFYKSNVRIEHSKFTNLQCEDALNIINSKFDIQFSEITHSAADAFDSDFSDGIVANTTFRSIQNDGIDLSGSDVTVRASLFSDIKDKAISVGEGSKANLTEVTIIKSQAGVVSKDKSIVNIHNSSFQGVTNALMAYVKKPQWGPAEIHCDDCLFEDVESIAVEQLGSRITVGGQEIHAAFFSPEQHFVVGYKQ